MPYLTFWGFFCLNCFPAFTSSALPEGLQHSHPHLWRQALIYERAEGHEVLRFFCWWESQVPAKSSFVQGFCLPVVEAAQLWCHAGAAQLCKKPKRRWLFFSAWLRNFRKGWCSLQLKEGGTGGAGVSQELAGWTGFCNSICRYGGLVHRAGEYRAMLTMQETLLASIMRLSWLSWRSPSLQFTSVWTGA